MIFISCDLSTIYILYLIVNDMFTDLNVTPLLTTYSRKYYDKYILHLIKKRDRKLQLYILLVLYNNIIPVISTK